MKLGSLFDGSGGFPLAGSLCGIEPVWAAEVEPYPIAVTRSRFPNMRHLGDISKINGAEIEPVDLITFGSPCQDLSVAGKRAGLKHEANGDEETTRSGLFIEAARIIKEMREATNGKYPRFALWENVPGAFSSNKGADFRIVCEELIKIVEPRAVMPGVPEKGWAYADSYCGDGWSLAYRVFDAQYWGVPQRRRRIHLVIDFRGQCAREILFEREGVRGYFAAGRTPWQAAPADAQGCAGAADAQGCAGAADREGESQGGAGGRGLDAVNIPYTLKIRGGVAVDSNGKGAGKGGIAIMEPKTFIIDNIGGQAEYGKASPVNGTLRAGAQGAIAYAVENHPADSRVNIDESGKVQTLTSRMGTGGGNVPMVMEPKVYESHPMDSRADTAGCNGAGWREGASYTLNTIDRPAVAYGIEIFHCHAEEETVPTLKARDWKDPNVVCYLEETPAAIDRAAFNQGKNAQYAPQFYTDGTSPTLVARGPSAVAHKTEIQHIVRRLTPTECARLQGFADRWGDVDKKDNFTDEEYSFWMEVRNTHAAINGKKVQDYTKPQMLTWYNKLHTDSAEYKMWGNGIALPPALYCMQGIVEALNREEDDLWLM